jgi:hypothetical protein
MWLLKATPLSFTFPKAQLLSLILVAGPTLARLAKFKFSNQPVHQRPPE